MLDIHLLQLKLHHWRERNFPDADATQQLLGVTEEVGELAHAHLKSMQGIRGTQAQHEKAAKDAVGDIAIYLLGYCSYHGWSFEDILFDTSEHVMRRDWIANPQDGGTS